MNQVTDGTIFTRTPWGSPHEIWMNDTFSSFIQLEEEDDAAPTPSAACAAALAATTLQPAYEICKYSTLFRFLKVSS